ANGGTAIGTIGAAGSATYSNGTQHASTAVGTAGQVLTSAGAGAPTWTTPATGNNWSILGNATTTPSTSAFGVAIGAGQNYVGTSDAKDFIVGSNNLERLRVTSAGFIGIGNTTPTAALHVGYIGMGGATPAKIQVDCGAEAISVRSANQGSTTIPVEIFCEGPNYGVNPASQLYTANNIGLKLSPWAGGEVEIALADWTGTNLMKIARPTNPAVRLALGNSTTEVLSVLSTGNVGINTNSPGAKLEIVGASGTTIKIVDGNQGAGKVLTSDGTGQGSWQTPGAGGPGWLLLGNAGTVDGTNFIGTTDNIPFNIRVNNQKAGRIDNATFNTFYGFQSGNANTSGTVNTAIGMYALLSNTTGFNNTAIGAAALKFNISGFNNTSIGYSSLPANTTGQANTATGTSSLQANTTGNNNTANGWAALVNNNIGSNNTANGSSALFTNVAGSNATAVGTNAMYYANDQAGAFNNYNVALGYEALRGSVSAAANTGNWNTAIGYQTLLGNTTGMWNTANGFQALQTNTTGNNNTASGSYALINNTTGSNNTAFGVSTLYWNNTGSFNTASGLVALYFNTIGSYNTAIGNHALYSNLTASRNTAIGNDALYTQSFNNGGVAWNSDNVAIGYQALFLNQPTANTNGNQNTAIGNQALYNNTIGTGNTATGYQSLYSNWGGGNFNTANGCQALYNAAGFYNTATGYQALYAGVGGNSNTANGYQALYANFSQFNTGVGAIALTGNTSGQYNSASGYSALSSNTSGSNNTANGANALRQNISGVRNNASGEGALVSNTIGDNNTACGASSLFSNTSGSDNTALGYFAGGGGGATHSQCTFIGSSTIISTVRTNVTALGYGIFDAQCTGNNQVMLGNTAIAQIRAQVGGLTAYSDARYKTNIKDNVAGLDFILKLKPVTYNVRPTELHKIWGTPDSLVNKMNFSEVEKETRIGFLAQDVEKAAKESGFNFPGIDVPRNDKEVYTLRYVDFIMPLVKGMQELNAEKDSLKFQISDLKLENQKQDALYSIQQKLIEEMQKEQESQQKISELKIAKLEAAIEKILQPTLPVEAKLKTMKKDMKK
ncbi:MAG: tail fiber domain-containing protein, partial [Bacteroidota bacterium]|nr:tail fiber domain-containing protein [Bacteroidota bacterium]